MSKKYFVWKDPACGGINIEWLEITGKEFYSMMKLPENKERRFVRLGNEVCKDDDVIYMEATEAQYLSWRKEKDERLYRQKVNSSYKTISMDVEAAGVEDVLVEETVADEQMNTEEQVINGLDAAQVRKALEDFTEEEVKILLAIYVHKRKFVSVAEELGVSRQAVSKRAERLLARLKKYFEN